MRASSRQVFRSDLIEKVFISLERERSRKPQYLRDTKHSELIASLRRAGFEVESLPGESPANLLHSPLLKSLPHENRPWIIHRDDEELFTLSHSGIPESKILEISPIGNPHAIKVLGSKVGFVQFCQDNEIAIPKSFVAESVNELSEHLSLFKDGGVIKGDQGGGGRQVVLRVREETVKSLDLSQITYPAVVQEVIIARECAVEAFYSEGRLIAWMFSEVEESINPTGPNLSRNYRVPDDLSFVEILKNFGRTAKVHGLANCSFFSTPDRGYLLYEADLRPNSWHYLFSYFEIDLFEAKCNSQVGLIIDPYSPQGLPKEGVTFRLAHRMLSEALDQDRWGEYIVLSCALLNGNTRNWAPISGEGENRFGAFAKLISILLVRMSYRYLPTRAKRLSKGSKVSYWVKRHILNV